MLNIVELGISRRIDVVSDGSRLVIVNFHHYAGAELLSADSDVVKLAGGEVVALENDFASLEAKIEDESQMTAVGDLERHIFFADVGVEAHQESFRIGCGETDADLLCQRRFVSTGEIVLDHVVALHVDTNFIGANRT